jgi:hypothetical protein
MSEARPYSRKSTLLELSRTRTGRVILALIALQVKKEARTQEEARLFAGAAGYMTLEKMVMVSRGKLPWSVVDSIVDLANGDPQRVATRALSGLRSVFNTSRS